MPTTYVFGAGASRHAGYPLASEMADGLMDFMLRSGDIQGRVYAEYLMDHFGRPSNIEDLITDVQARIDLLKNAESAGDQAEYRRLGTRLAYLGTAVREWFRQIHEGPAHAYAEFADRIIRPGDFVITFNYDDSLERELKRADKWDASYGYGFQLGAESVPYSVIVLKLHGSINWLVSVFGGATGGSFFVSPERSSLGERPVVHQADLNYLGYHDFTGNTYRSGGAFPCLIMPGRTKRFFYDTSFGHEYVDFWTSLWSQATDAVRQSDQIVVCGYSMLPVDERACELLLNEPRKDGRVTIVSGSQGERIVAQFSAAGFDDVTGDRDGHFEDWVQRYVER